MKKGTNRRGAGRSLRTAVPDGFALVVTLSLMVLLSLLAVGLLGLSSVALRAASSEADSSEARANARLALNMAIAQLQLQAGPDTRITVSADQVPGETPDETGAAEGRRFWTGVYDAWPTPRVPGEPDLRPLPSFRSWLVSGETTEVTERDTVESPPANSDVLLLGEGTVGTEEGRIAAPPVVAGSGRLAWWVGDQGVKAMLAKPRTPEPNPSPTMVRAGLQGAPGTAVQLAEADDTTPFAGLAVDDPRVMKVTDWRQAGLLIDEPEDSAPLFHDLAASSSGLLTNVRSGGFRKDLSMYLEKDAPPAADFPAPLVADTGALYEIGGQDGIRIQELWSYYNLYKELETSAISFTTGGSGGGASNPYLKTEADPNLARADDFFNFKRPAVIGYHLLFAFHRIVQDNAATDKLGVKLQPILTFWNPYDVPIRVSPAHYTVRFFKIPYQIDNLRIESTDVNGDTTTSGPFLINLGGMNGHPSNRTSPPSSYDRNNYDPVYLVCGGDRSMVLKPGEVLHFSAMRTPPEPAGWEQRDTYANQPAIHGIEPGEGVVYDLRDAGNNNAGIPIGKGRVKIQEFSITPNRMSLKQGVWGFGASSPHSSISQFECYLGNNSSSWVGHGGAFVDYIRGVPAHSADKGDRFFASEREVESPGYPATFPVLEVDELVLNPGPSSRYFLHYSSRAKTEEGSLRRGGFLTRMNPSASYVDFAELSDTELDVVPFEVRAEAIDAADGSMVIDQDGSGRGYFGGDNDAGSGTSFLSTHSVPREPVVSLAALQHSMANGFNRLRPDKSAPYYSGGPNNQSIRMPMLPQISHAIGNSLAPAVLEPTQTSGSISDGRVLADHSYLANMALWDDWFFSGIAPRDAGPNATGWSQKELAQNFFDGDALLPVSRYVPAVGSATSESVLDRLFSGAEPTDEATALTASFLRVEGMFNVNSTSIEAWKGILGSLRGHPVVSRDSEGDEEIQSTVETPVIGLLGPTPHTADDANMDLKNPAQWTGRRSLTDDQLQTLAEKLVEEIRQRGPFLSLADFINRRPGTDRKLARAGTLQAAIDQANLNGGFDARLGIASASLAFPEVEESVPAAHGIPGVVKQADLLTPIAPILSVRSDTFIIRAYGEKRDASGERVLARAWCEAVVERDREFVDPADSAGTAIDELRDVNLRFGRRFVITSFRWLNPEEV